MRALRANNFVLFCLLSAFWGGSYLSIHFVIEVFPPILAAGLRVALAAPVVFAIALWRAPRPWPTGAMRRRHLLTGIILTAIPWMMLFWGQTQVAPAVASILIAATPLFAAVFITLRGEPARHPLQWLGLALGFAGVVCIFWPHLQGELTIELLGLCAVLGASMCYGLGITRIHHDIHDDVSISVMVLWQIISASALLLVTSALFETWPSWEMLYGQTQAWLGLAYLAVCSTALAFLLLFYLTRTQGGVVASMVSYVVPLIALGLDSVILQTVPAPAVLWGAVVMFAGVAITRNVADWMERWNTRREKYDNVGT